MRIIGDTNIDFMRQRPIWLTVSLILLIVSIGSLATKGIVRGVEFEGGAEVILYYNEAPDLDRVRNTLDEAGLTGSTVTTFGGTEGREIAVRVAGSDEQMAAEAEGEDAEAGRDLARKVVESLLPDEIKQAIAAGRIDLNSIDQVGLTSRLIADAGMETGPAEGVAASLLDYRNEHSGVFADLDEALGVAGVTDTAAVWLRENAVIGPFGLRGQEVIAGAVSREMRQKAISAIVFALAGMLIYIWIRFQLQYGLAAIAALVHDTLIVLGAFSLLGFEANLPVVAAFLTLVGYSVNDTIVVFDRIRENLNARSTGKLLDVVNISINQNLSRTLITSLTTWAVVLCLLFLGGQVIRPFAFVLAVGVIVGTYSSIYVASPILLFWQKIFAARKERAAARKSPEKAHARG